IRVDDITWHDVDFVSARDFSALTDAHEPRFGDILFSRNASFGIPCFVSTSARFAIGQDVVVMTHAGADTRFVFFGLQSHGVAMQIAKNSGGSTFGRINLAEIRRLMLPRPSPEEQKLIAETLETLVSRQQRESESVAKLRLLKQGLMEDLLTGRVRVTN